MVRRDGKAQALTGKGNAFDLKQIQVLDIGIRAFGSSDRLGDFYKNINYLFEESDFTR